MTSDELPPAFAARVSWIKRALRDLTGDGGEALLNMAEECARGFDSRAPKLEASADRLRRLLYKYSILKCFLEARAGAGVNELEIAHRHRLRYQTLQDFDQMVLDGDFPFPDVVY